MSVSRITWRCRECGHDNVAPFKRSTQKVKCEICGAKGIIEFQPSEGQTT